MTTALRLQVADSIARIIFDLPGSKANTLGQSVLGEFETMIAQLARRIDLRGLILESGKPGMFIAGADIKELGTASAGDPNINRTMMKRGLAIIDSFDALPFPTIAVSDGPCMGGGTEFALGCDVRLAGTHPKCEIGLPEVKIGIIPGWGGTQRLMRLIGPSQAADMICTGDAVKPIKARDLGIVFDMVPSEKLHDEANRLLADMHKTGDWKEIRRKKRLPVGLSEEQLRFTFDMARGYILEKTKGQYPAPLAALSAMEKGCNRTLEEGLEFETEAMVPLIGSTISKNLIAIFFMTQR